MSRDLNFEEEITIRGGHSDPEFYHHVSQFGYEKLLDEQIEVQEKSGLKSKKTPRSSFF